MCLMELFKHWWLWDIKGIDTNMHLRSWTHSFPGEGFDFLWPFVYPRGYMEWGAIHLGSHFPTCPVELHCDSSSRCWHCYFWIDLWAFIVRLVCLSYVEFKIMKTLVIVLSITSKGENCRFFVTGSNWLEANPCEQIQENNATFWRSMEQRFTLCKPDLPCVWHWNGCFGGSGKALGPEKKDSFKITWFGGIFNF